MHASGRWRREVSATTFASIAAEEEEHVDHAMATLRAERALDPQRFDDKVYRLHLEVMTTLAKMLAKECKDGHCEVCHASCVKPALFDVSLSAAELRGASLQQYLKTLDMLGITRGGHTRMGGSVAGLGGQL